MQVLFYVVMVVVLMAILGFVFQLGDPLDSEGGSSTPGVKRPVSERIRESVPWVLPGLIIAGVLALITPGSLAIAIWFLAMGNLLGTVLFLLESPGERSSRAMKALFVLQIPVGTLFVIGNGI